MRPTWTETYLEVAKVMAKRSRCVRAQVGAVVTDTSNRIIATGYNGPPARYPIGLNSTCDLFCARQMNGPSDDTMRTYTDCPSIHAEANALLFVDRRHAEGGNIYVSGPVCIGCAKLIANSGLAFVHWLMDDGRQYREVNESRDLLLRTGLQVFAWES